MAHQVNGDRHADAAFAERVRRNQEALAANLKTEFDFIVCGSGSSGSVVARRLAEDSNVSVLLLEAGASDDVPSVTDAAQWSSNLGSERDWNFTARPNANLNGRAIPMNMGKVLGGGSSINVSVWSRGHKNDWDYFAAEAGDDGWSYAAVLDLYRRIEDWHGIPDPDHRGTGGLVFVQPVPDPSPIAPAFLEAARSIGIATFGNQNGAMMEGDGGSSILDVRIRNGRRLSLFRSYTFPFMDRPNLTVLTGALVVRLTFEGKRATGVDVLIEGTLCHIGVRCEIVLSMGAINTPKVLMQSGIGDEFELRRLGIPVLEHLPGVGRNFQDHFLINGCVWEYVEPMAPGNGAFESTLFWRSLPNLDTPDIQMVQSNGQTRSSGYAMFDHAVGSAGPSYGIRPGIVHPQSVGRLHLTGPSPVDPIEIEDDILDHPDDLAAAIRSIELCREIGNAPTFHRYAKREVMPGNLKGRELEDFVRNSISTFHHQTCTAKMGRDSMSVVDANLRVYGIDNLRVADGSIMPRVTTGNTMAPCAVIGERVADSIRREYRLDGGLPDNAGHAGLH